MRKILIIRFSSIGDIVLTTPIIRCLKKRFPESEIHFLTKDKHLNTLQGNPYIKKIYTFHSNLRKITAQLRKERYDCVIDLHRNIRTAFIKSKIGGKKYTYPKYNFQKWIYTRLHLDLMPHDHIVDRYFKAVEPLQVLNDGAGLDFFIREKDRVDLSNIPDISNRSFVSIVIGGTYYTKRLPTQKLISMVQKINKPMVLLGGETDKSVAFEIIRHVNGKHVYNACGIYTLVQSASIMEQSDLVITHDTGLMHIAAALKKPIISIWGNTTPRFGMTPYYGDKKVTSYIMEVHGLKCRPCSKLGHSSCPKKHFRCMENIETRKIAEIANRNE